MILFAIKLMTCKKKDKEDLEEVSTELELADEDELVPYVLLLLAPASSVLF